MEMVGWSFADPRNLMPMDYAAGRHLMWSFRSAPGPNATLFVRYDNGQLCTFKRKPTASTHAR